MAPDLVKEDNLLALHFAGDGTASASTIAAFYREEASKNGAELIEANVTEICQLDRNISGVMTSSGFIQAKEVIIATGAWAMQLCNLDVPVPVIPVAHPYMYGEYHEPNPQKYPFVRWPEYLVYSRDHGPFYGLGSYNHKPLYQKPGETAIGDWAGHFDITLNRALSLIPEKTKLVPREKFNGIFSMTPDNMPLVGKVSSVNGLYMAAAVWITHAAGSAKFLIQIMKGETVDVATQRALDPNRFKGRDMETLIKQALDGYNHIYKTQENSE
ncbi:FAD dependent oxidoreductase [Talaromyces proteolyticus]|uniref:FAD dependent oxidoreductase n=1 Tax=Talaromyces proteolyticus TaxID=1131652 RepID=A0AAD4KIW8_9EURO|nr:FAD dependent oxidoreductase [Talaromyces proteolyticus]KAH8692242.1 FAD dependent oxidoreductase [Talaromyces proteolyticus]